LKTTFVNLISYYKCLYPMQSILTFPITKKHLVHILAMPSTNNNPRLCKVNSWLGYQKGLQRTTLDFCLYYIIIIVVDCRMPIDKMMSFLIDKNILK
jgi:hypothetical protein